MASVLYTPKFANLNDNPSIDQIVAFPGYNHLSFER